MEPTHPNRYDRSEIAPRGVGDDICAAKQSTGSTKTSAITAGIWTMGGYGFSQVIRLGSHLILAWMLAPEVFGLMALVKVFMHGLSMFSDIGIQPSIIQSKRGFDPKFLNTAWTMQVIRGVSLWLISCLLAWPVAMLFARNDPAAAQLMYLIPVAALVAILEGFQSTALATLNKSLRLGRLTMLASTSQVVSLTVMITWAWFDASVWAMIAGGLAAGVYKLALSHLIVPGHRSRFHWDRECAAELIRFGKWIFLSTVFTFLSLNLDRIILGNVLTLAELGLYSIAFVFCRVPMYVSGRLGVAVLFPVYAKFRDDTDRMMSVALRAREVVLWVGGSICLAMAIGARLFFESLWDDRYLGIASMAQWLVFYVWTMIMLLTMERIPLAMGNSRALFTSNVVRTLGVVVGAAGYFLAGLPGFIVGMSAGPLLAQVQLLRHIPSERMALWGQGMRFTGLGLAYGVPAVLLTEWLYAGMSYWSWAAVVMATSAVPLCAAAGVAWMSVRGGTPGKRHAEPMVTEQVGVTP